MPDPEIPARGTMRRASIHIGARGRSSGFCNSALVTGKGIAMKMRLFVTSFAACCAAMILAAMTLSPQDPAEMEAMWAEMMEKYGAPSAEHEMLAERVGRWNTSTKFWMAPGAPPETHEGEATFEMMMDGRYLVQHYTMDFNGMPFEGAGMIGYDRMKNEYQSIWIDNMGTGIMWSAGQEKDGEYTYKGEAPDMMAGKYVPCRMIERITDSNSFVMEMYTTGPDGNEIQSMEISYTRAD